MDQTIEGGLRNSGEYAKYRATQSPSFAEATSRESLLRKKSPNRGFSYRVPPHPHSYRVDRSDYGVYEDRQSPVPSPSSSAGSSATGGSPSCSSKRGLSPLTATPVAAMGSDDDGVSSPAECPAPSGPNSPPLPPPSDEEQVAHAAQQASSAAQVEAQQSELIGVLASQHVQLKRRLGPQHPDTVAACETYVAHSTGMATMYLETGRGRVAWKVLQQVEKAAEEAHPEALLPAVQNSMACCLRRAGRHRAALGMLQKAASTVRAAADPHLHSASMRGNILLNLCTALSDVGKHEEALAAAQQSIQCLRQGLRDRGRHRSALFQAGGHTPVSATTGGSAEPAAAAAAASGDEQRERADLAAMLAMALHNTAVQHEHMKQYQLSLAAYQCAANCASQCLGSGHAITRSLASTCKAATQSIRKTTGITLQRRSAATSLGELN